MRDEAIDGSAEGRGAFGGFIGPRTLVEQVRIAAPFLFDGTHPLSADVPETRGDRLIEHGFHALGWWSILRHADLVHAEVEPSPAARSDYFALCLAAHFASVGSYVPTDVDAKIRRALWFEPQPADERARRCELAFHLRHWDVRGVSARIEVVEGFGNVSGHDGECLSVHCGGMLALREAGDVATAARFEAEIDAELDREARAFEAVERTPGRELELLRLAWILTHNAGDVGQGLAAATAGHRFGDLARGGFERYGGAFGRAAALYRSILAPEGHRNYPLRATKLLRAHPDLLLPLGPCLDAWGARLATWSSWSAAQRAEVVSAIVDGCRKVSGQESYFRALAGFDAAHPGGLASRELDAYWTSSIRKMLRTPELRAKVGVTRASFEASLRKRVRSVLAS
jgi:hypothetical protein